MAQLQDILGLSVLFLLFYGVFGTDSFLPFVILGILIHVSGAPAINVNTQVLSACSEVDHPRPEYVDNDEIMLQLSTSDDEESEGHSFVTEASEVCFMFDNFNPALANSKMKDILPASPHGNFSRYESFPNKSNTSKSQITKLCRTLKSALTPSMAATHHYFVPETALTSIITPHTIEKQIRLGNPEMALETIDTYVAGAFLRAKRVFAILVYIHRGAEIGAFLRWGLHDGMLPVTVSKETAHGKSILVVLGKDGQKISVFQSWTAMEIQKFEKKQWQMLAPTFKYGKHLDLPEKTILPFKEIRKEEEHRGGYSTVSKILIHPDHHEFSLGGITKVCNWLTW